MRVPRNVREALRKGYAVSGEQSQLSANEKCRAGVLLLSKGAVRLQVPYFASTNGGYHFGTLRQA